MISRQIKENHWKDVYRQITTYGRNTPLSLQYDIDVNYNGVDYILKVQPVQNRKISALQAIGVYPENDRSDSKRYRLIDDNAILSALLEIIIYQSSKGN